MSEPMDVPVDEPGDEDVLRFGLETLIAPVPVSRFFAEHWPARPLVARGPLSRLGGLLAIPELSSVEALARVYRERLPVWFPASLGREARGQVYGTRFEALDALTLYRGGATLFFEHADRWVPALRPLARAVEGDLHLHPGSVYCSVFASPGGAGSAAHFDPDLNLSVQLRGHKRWRIAPNRHVSAPTRGYSVVEGGAPDSDQLRGYCPGPLPVDMPAEAEVVDMEPGTVLFLPRGYWHATETHDESFALVFAVNPRTWVKLVLARLEEVLVGDPRWRGHVLGIGGSAPGWAEARAQLDALLQALPQAARSLDAEAVLVALAGRDRRYRRTPARATLERRDADSEEPWLMAVEDEVQRSELWLPDAYAGLCRWILARSEPFSPPELGPHAGGLAPDDLEQLLDALVEAGVLEGL